MMVVQEAHDSTRDVARKNLIRQTWLLAGRTHKPNTVNRAQSIDHTTNSLETAGNIGLHLRKWGHDLVSKVQEEGLARFGRLSAVVYATRDFGVVGLNAATRKLNIVELRSFE